MSSRITEVSERCYRRKAEEIEGRRAGKRGRRSWDKILAAFTCAKTAYGLGRGWQTEYRTVNDIATQTALPHRVVKVYINKMKRNGVIIPAGKTKERGIHETLYKMPRAERLWERFEPYE